MLKFRFAKEEDIDTYYNWANDPVVRANSYASDEISYDNHVKWFKSKIASPNSKLYFFTNEQDIPVGQVRIERQPEETIIGISVDEKFRRQSLAPVLLTMACDDYLNKFPGETVIAYIKAGNEASLRSFLKAGFVIQDEIVVHNIKSHRLAKKINS